MTPISALLVLEDGSVFEGLSLGAAGRAQGEVVFNTSMTGYQEMLTDPSYRGQILTLTYPLIGNYGINDQAVESRHIQAAGLVVREACLIPSHWQSQGTLDDYLKSQGIPGICGVDTRALTRKLRTKGVMMGTITSDESPAQALERLKVVPRYDFIDFVPQVTTLSLYRWEGPPDGPHIVAIDCGLKLNILRLLSGLGCAITVVPATASAEDVLALEPRGVVLSPGPGDPALLGYMEQTVKGLIGKVPILGICLGHQMLGRAFGGRTFKLKFGHRGGNHPVKDLQTGRVYITAQNHGYAVDGDSLPPQVEVSHINLNDGTVEGLRHRELPILAIQYHSEASPGPLDNVYVFERFVDMVRKNDV
ncbi:MAG: glutamine-hydrolyzing carbamoyl-phosphate synthase small subunit [Chloroflexi bacterium]|nr:glutamine-hydrolyzing carbamoyl-phosphate synthase small subunit [Chloroflexota bacterium]